MGLSNLEQHAPQMGRRSHLVKTLTANPNNILPVTFPEDTTNGTDGDDWSALSLEAAAQQLLNRFELLKLQANPLGTVLAWAGSSAALPSKYLICDGSAISRTTYASLFAQVGTAFGPGNNSSTFNLPDLRDKFVMGSSTGNALGATGGENSHVLTANEMPTHNHATTISGAGAHGHLATSSNAGEHSHAATAGTAGGHSHGASTGNDGEHSHYIRGDGSSGGTGYWAPALVQAASWNDYAGGPTGGTPPTNGSTPADSNPLNASGAAKDAIPPQGSGHSHAVTVAAVGDHTHTVAIADALNHSHAINVTGVGDHTHTISNPNAGGGAAHENRPAFVALAYIIRAL